MHTSSIRSALASTFQIPLRPILTNTLSNPTRSNLPAPSITNTITKRVNPRLPAQNATFSTSSAMFKKKSQKQKPDQRITLIRYFLHHPTTLMPRPLRFSRNRYLRHWTIHRAWNLYRQKVRKNRELELERQYNAMRDANEELRVGAGDGGRLFRMAMMKTGVWSIPERGGGVPIEYSRGLSEWVGTRGTVGGKARIWDDGWKR